MQAVRHCVWIVAAVLCAALGVAPGPAMAANRYSVTLDPPTFSPDESAELTITISGDEDAVPQIPRVPGLVINPDGQSSSIQQVNGGVTAIFARTYRVTASREGTYTIAPLQVGNATLTPVIVHVVPPGTARAARPQAGPGRGSAPDTAAAMRAAMPMMKVVLPSAPLYAGELVPIQVKGYFRDGTSARQTGPMVAQVEAFTVAGLDKPPSQTLESINGVTYRVLTWNCVLGALKSGSYPINIELPLVLNIQMPGTDSDMAARLRALFGTSSSSAFMDDSAFSDAFGRVIQKALTLKPDPTPVTVLPLPAQGRPADFSGAVGEFQVGAELTPSVGTVGDPLTFKLTVTGKGNLSRVTTEALPASAQWRVYRTDAKLTTDDDTGLKGYKTFTQPVVPLQAGTLTVPAVSFSYFDPEQGRYVTRQTAPIPVSVRPGANALAAGTPAGTSASAPPGPDDALAADAASFTRATATLEPLVRRPWFVWAAFAPLVLMLAAVTLIRRQRRRAADPELQLHAARLAAVRINLESMAAALARHDATAFFTAARHALQERLADLWQVNADAVDEALVARRLTQQAASEVRSILAMADRVTYAGERPDAQALQQWQRRILAQMDQLEAVS